MKLLMAVLILSLVSDTAVSEEGASDTAALGLSRQNAIETCNRQQYEYLDQLRCANGKRAKYVRLGSVGPREELLASEDYVTHEKQVLYGEPVAPGEKDFHIINHFQVKCRGTVLDLYIDRYHCPATELPEAPPGFTLGKKKKQK